MSGEEHNLEEANSSSSASGTIQPVQHRSLQDQLVNTPGSSCHGKPDEEFLQVNTPGNTHCQIDGDTETIESTSSPFNLEMHIAKLQQMRKSPGEGFMFHSRPMIISNTALNTDHQVSHDHFVCKRSVHIKPFFTKKLLYSISTDLYVTMGYLYFLSSGADAGFSEMGEGVQINVCQRQSFVCPRRGDFNNFYRLIF